MKTFTKENVLEMTYHGDKVHDLAWFLEQAGGKPFKGATSVFIHGPEESSCDLTVAIEAYDDAFDDVTRTPKLRDAFKARVYRHLTKLFPNITIDVVWYSGYSYHQYDILTT